MKIKDNILQTIGNTPMIKLNKIVAGISANIFAKVEILILVTLLKIGWQ